MRLVHINNQLDHMSPIIQTLKALLQDKIKHELERTGKLRIKKSQSEHSSLQTIPKSTSWEWQASVDPSLHLHDNHHLCAVSSSSSGRTRREEPDKSSLGELRHDQRLSRLLSIQGKALFMNIEDGVVPGGYP